jgi:RNA polymerase sigma factor for flagellar operon FliA
MTAMLDLAPSFLRHTREATLLDYYSVVQRIAGRMARRLPPNVDKEELIQEGMIGLMDAHERFDRTLGVPFKAYAETRIQGAMYDWLRKQDVVPRSVRRKANAIDRARADLKRTLDRQPSRAELAEHLELSTAELGVMEKDARIRKVISMDASTTADGETPLVESLCQPDAEGADDSLFGKQVRDLTYSAIENLPDRERKAIHLYHLQGFTLKETGRALGVTESRACQLTKQAITRLRFRLRNSVHPV